MDIFMGIRDIVNKWRVDFIFKGGMVYLHIQLSVCFYTASCKSQRPPVSEKLGLPFEGTAPTIEDNTQAGCQKHKKEKTRLCEVVRCIDHLDFEYDCKMYVYLEP